VAYGVGKPAHREATKDTDADAVRAITEARKAFEARTLPALPPANQ
jgi:hypothetical protein